MVAVNRRFALQVAIGLAVLSSVASAQRPDPPPPVPSPHFEVASIKRNLSGSTDDRMNVFPGGRLVASNIPILTLIRNVYRVQYSQLAGGPEWLATERWDILATGAGAATWHSAFRACSIARSLTRPDCPARTGSS